LNAQLAKVWGYKMVAKTRNYDREAKEMVAGLGSNQKYELYEIVLEQLQRRSSDDRTRELRAVQSVLEQDRGLDHTRLKKMRVGDTGMAADITGGSLVSNQKKNKRKN
jgi:copper oxidase (laccase) domain-containing protein